MDDLDLTRSSEDHGGSGSIAIFLGLYLLILAFFILLVSISTTEEIKSKAVMDSLSSTFSTLLPPASELTDFSGRSGEVVAAQQFQDEVADLFISAIQVARVEVVQPGEQMRVTVPADALFVPGKAVLRPAQMPLLDRLVAALSKRPPGFRYDMEMVMGSEYTPEKVLPIGETLEVARAGAFAREMRGRGAPSDSMVIGLRHSDPREVVFWFYVRDMGQQDGVPTGSVAAAAPGPVSGEARP